MLSFRSEPSHEHEHTEAFQSFVWNEDHSCALSVSCDQKAAELKQISTKAKQSLVANAPLNAQLENSNFELLRRARFVSLTAAENAAISDYLNGPQSDQIVLDRFKIELSRTNFDVYDQARG